MQLGLRITNLNERRVLRRDKRVLICGSNLLEHFHLREKILNPK